MFRFRLQRVLEMRERTERDAAAALAGAQELAEQARREGERLAAARDALSTQTAAPGDAESVGALRTLHFLLGRLDERVASAAHDATAAARVVTEREDALRAAFRDRRALDRLRERHAESHRAAESAADRQQMDEIALTRFTQPQGGAPTTSSHGS